jgi:hypothetical protein
MSENTISDQVWTQIIKKRGGGAISFLPNEAGEMLDEYKQEMTRLGYCSYCEGKLDDENHPGGKCRFKELDEREGWNICTHPNAKPMNTNPNPLDECYKCPDCGAWLDENFEVVRTPTQEIPY